MSKRFRQKPPPATDSLAGTDEPRRLSRDASAELHHLVEMFGMLGQAMPEALAIGPAMDLAAELTEEYRDLGRDLREGVRRILREAAPKPREAAVVGEISDIAPLLTELSREVELPSPELAPDEVAAAFVGLIGLVNFRMALREAGFARDIAPDAASPELRALGEATGHQVLEMQVDNVLAEWFRALSEQAGIPGPGVSPLKGRKTKPKKRKRRR